MEPIKGFFGPYRWLSNFHLVPIEIEGLTYPSTEHAYQAMKTLDSDIRIKIRNTVEPRDVKRMSRSFTLRPNWDEIKYSIMLQISRLKYRVPYLRERLSGTKDAYLEETNTWNDRYWGVCNGTGKNNLGKILMKIREEIR